MPGPDSPVERSRRCLAPQVHGFLPPHRHGAYWRPKMLRLVTRSKTADGRRTWRPFAWFCPECGRLELVEELEGPMHFGATGPAP